MSPEAVAVSGPATNTSALLPNGSTRVRCAPLLRSSCTTAPPPAGIHSASPERTAWKTGSQPLREAVPGEVPRFGGGFQSVATIQSGTSFPPCHTKCCSFQICEPQASGPQGKGLRDPGGLQETYVPALFTAT